VKNTRRNIHECWISALNTNPDLGVNLHAFLRVQDDLCAFVPLCDQKIHRLLTNILLNFLAQRHEGTKIVLNLFQDNAPPSPVILKQVQDDDNSDFWHCALNKMFAFIRTDSECELARFSGHLAPFYVSVSQHCLPMQWHRPY
jgi:hypothetical protein